MAKMLADLRAGGKQPRLLFSKVWFRREWNP